MSFTTVAMETKLVIRHHCLLGLSLVMEIGVGVSEL